MGKMAILCRKFVHYPQLDIYFSSNDCKRFEIPKILQIPEKICVFFPQNSYVMRTVRGIR